jgi:PiT family inorganic phosphate transporter
VFGVIGCKVVLVKTFKNISGEQENRLISEVYRYLMVFAACLVCLAHGSNDVANSISPLLLVMQVEEQSNLWAYLLGGSGISLGLLFLGKNVM